MPTHQQGFHEFPSTALEGIQAKDASKPEEKTCRSAVILFGVMQRSIQYVVDKFRENVIASLAEDGEVDIFFHSWDISKIVNPRAGEQGVPVHPSDVYRWLPEAIGLFESQEEFDQEVNWKLLLGRNPMPRIAVNQEAARVTLMNFRRALESQKRAWKYFASSKKHHYQNVILTRPDLRFLSKLPVARNQARPIDKVVKIPQFHGWGGLNDRFAMGSEQTIEILANRTEFADGWLMAGGGGNPEQLLQKWLDRNNLPVTLFDFEFQRIRANGEIAGPDLCLDVASRE